MSSLLSANCFEMTSSLLRSAWMMIWRIAAFSSGFTGIEITTALFSGSVSLQFRHQRLVTLFLKYIAACNLHIIVLIYSYLLPRFTEGVRVTSISVRRNPSELENDLRRLSASELHIIPNTPLSNRSVSFIDPSELQREMISSSWFCCIVKSFCDDVCVFSIKELQCSLGWNVNKMVCLSSDLAAFHFPPLLFGPRIDSGINRASASC